MTLTKTLEPIIIFCVGAIVFTVGLSHQEIIGFESRFYLFALEMWRHGPSWFPTTYQQPYPDYPVTATFLIYLTAHMLGGLNKLAAVLPSALAAAMTLSVTYLIGALHNRRWGFYAVLFLLFTNTFLSEARTISLDQYTTLITVLCFYLVYQKRSLWFVLPLLVLGFAFRGPIGLVIPTGVLCVYYLLEKDVKKLLFIGCASVFLLGICSAILFMLAYHVGGMAFVQDVVRMEIVGRIHDIDVPPYYFYFVESIGAYAITFPLGILIFLGLGSQLFKKNLPVDLQFMQKLLGWVLVILIGLSIPADKKIRYILPMAPALALFCAYLFMAIQEKKYFFYLRRIFYIVTLTFVLIFLLVVEPINIKLNRTRDFVEQIEKLRHSRHAQLVFYQESADGLPIKYVVNMQHEEKPIFIQNPKELLRSKQPAFFITRTEYFLQIPKSISGKFHEVQRGKLGHMDVVVFSRQ